MATRKAQMEHGLEKSDLFMFNLLGFYYKRKKLSQIKCCSKFATLSFAYNKNLSEQCF